MLRKEQNMDKKKTTTTTKTNTKPNKTTKWTEGKGTPVDGKKIKWAGKC